VKLRLHAAAHVSTCNGPGRRIVVWTQGCGLACPDCFNPSTHSRTGGGEIEVEELARRIDVWAREAKEPVRGVTLSGGEPLAQARAVAALLDLIPPSLDVLLYTGHEPKEIRRSASMRAVIRRCDAVLAGRFDRDQIHPYAAKALMLRTGRIRADEILAHRSIEFTIDRHAGGIMTGFPWRVP
jgi:pyruvate-formate lyase-activating enzyme